MFMTTPYKQSCLKLLNYTYLGRTFLTLLFTLYMYTWFLTCIYYIHMLNSDAISVCLGVELIGLERNANFKNRHSSLWNVTVKALINNITPPQVNPKDIPKSYRSKHGCKHLKALQLGVRFNMIQDIWSTLHRIPQISPKIKFNLPQNT